MRRTGRPTTAGNETAVGPAGASCRVEADESSAVVRVVGVLEPAGAPAVRDALLTRLSERPGPVVADLTDLRVADPATRSVFADVQREVVGWPAAGLLVCDPGASTDRPDPALAGVPVLPSLDAALAALARSPMAAVLSADLAPVVDSARQARGLVTEGCRRWGMPALAEVGGIVVTELVNNVVAHAGTPMTVRIAPTGDTLHLAVRDHSPDAPAFAGPAATTSIGGRGLLLVDALADRWGSTPLPDGKLVWCVVTPTP
ncbi:sulfate transporter [Micromonospora sp. 15K316]|uniref:ATP-binding protein n=1 Tax=Micromonospora sp. 15K316 TaxID=2530376 RepID=UPI00104EBBA7|nr:ATP-binding protein [Micromonospora sp. 15K316]TDC36869.1 sulfate transporter [Micromonospora sp. 15K316]